MWWTKETHGVWKKLGQPGGPRSQSCAPPPSLPPPGLSQGTAGSWRHEAQGGGTARACVLNVPQLPVVRGSVKPWPHRPQRLAIRC